jgi:hypothetical protein
MKVVTKPKVVRRTKDTQVDDHKQLAAEAVVVFEHMRADLAGMEEEFADRFPEAQTELVAIDEYRGSVRDHLKKTKEMVRLAGETIGDFKYQAKSTAAGYLAKELLDICVKNNDGELLLELARVGAITIKVAHAQANLYFDRNKKDADKVSEAWEESKPMTPAITAPKL